MRWCCLGLFLAACGGGGTNTAGDGILRNPVAPNDVTMVAPSTPKGSVAGTVVSAKDNLPLSGAAVTVVADQTVSTTTDSAGHFIADKLSANSPISVTLSANGYTSAWITTVIPGTTGNVPESEGVATLGPIALFPTSFAMEFTVIGFDGTTIPAPAGVMEVTPSYVDYSTIPRFFAGYDDVSVNGQNGDLKFPSLPGPQDLTRIAGANGTYSLYVAPVDINGDGIYEYAGKTLVFSAPALLAAPTIQNVVLNGAADVAPGLKVDSTNVRNFLASPSVGKNNLVPATGQVFLLYNQRIVPGSVQVEIRNDIGDTILASSFQVSALGNSITAKLSGPGGFVDGTKYNILVNATSQDPTSPQILQVVAPFFGGDPTLPKKASPFLLTTESPALTLVNGDTIDVNFNVAIGNFQTGSFYIPLYFKYDLDGDGTVGNYPGEWGSGQPFCVSGFEPAVYGKTSGYSQTAKAVFNLLPGLRPPVPLGVPVGMVVAMSEAATHCGATPVFSIWGDAIDLDYGSDPATQTVTLTHK